MREVRGSEIAMIFQDPMTSLNPVYRVGWQIAEQVREHEGLSAAAARDRAVELLRAVGIPDAERRVEDYPHQFSGGMRQRVMIAMALSCRPRVLIADEPTTALDVTIQAQILELLADVQKRMGMSVLLITHDLGVVAETASRVIVMYAGEVVEEAPVRELFRAAHHPYTEGLLRAMPRVGGGEDRLATIPGSVPPPTAWPHGCRFRDRCPYAWELCEREHPPLYQVGTGHVSRCHLAIEPERRNHPHVPLAVAAGAEAGK
jgi:oligopeptide/dipeptide ABC transporter ATP-binding protein